MALLIVYYSFTGNNRLLASHLAQGLSADITEVVEMRRRRPVSIALDLLLRRRGRIRQIEADPTRYGGVLFLAPIWDRHIATPMRAAMASLAPGLPAYAFATLCGGPRQGQAETIRTEAEAATGRAPELIVELHVTELLAEGGADGPSASRYRVRAEEIGRFADALAPLLRWAATIKPVELPPMARH